ncbi:hypothetical protein F5B21DRAFT_490278 [Xylaria acuta]|nr:hypothetical protein F5B21DRAFT_490278 [Xylaria acuta]
MQEKIKAKRNDGFRGIAAKFDAYTSKKEKEIEDHYASEAKKKSAELKDLLTRYALALEQRASIEKSIEEIVLDTRKDINELSVLLKTAYSGRQQKSHAAAGSFSSIAPVPARGTASANPTNPRAAANMQNKAQADRSEEESRDHVYAGKENVFDQISW